MPMLKQLANLNLTQVEKTDGKVVAIDPNITTEALRYLANLVDAFGSYENYDFDAKVSNVSDFYEQLIEKGTNTGIKLKCKGCDFRPEGEHNDGAEKREMKKHLRILLGNLTALEAKNIPTEESVDNYEYGNYEDEYGGPVNAKEIINEEDEYGPSPGHEVDKKGNQTDAGNIGENGEGSGKEETASGGVKGIANGTEENPNALIKSRAETPKTMEQNKTGAAAPARRGLHGEGKGKRREKNKDSESSRHNEMGENAKKSEKINGLKDSENGTNGRNNDNHPMVIVYDYERILPMEGGHLKRRLMNPVKSMPVKKSVKNGFKVVPQVDQAAVQEKEKKANQLMNGFLNLQDILMADDSDGDAKDKAEKKRDTFDRVAKALNESKYAEEKVDDQKVEAEGKVNLEDLKHVLAQ